MLTLQSKLSKLFKSRKRKGHANENPEMTDTRSETVDKTVNDDVTDTEDDTDNESLNKRGTTTVAQLNQAIIETAKEVISEPSNKHLTGFKRTRV
jgi:hypothetical protein